MLESSFSIISSMILLVFVLDPVGNIPLLLSILKNTSAQRRYQIIFRESLIGLAILLVFFFFGEQFLSIFHLQTESITIAGGIIFFVISLKMIFPSSSESVFASSEEEPLVVPIAMPMIAGPGALATIMVLVKTNPTHLSSLFTSLFFAWAISTIVLIFSPILYKILKNKGLKALERLMGMLLLIMAVQMFIDGIKGLIQTYM